MDGIHDLGGRHGFGPVEIEADEPVFHEPWERAARAATVAVLLAVAKGNTPAFRHAIERIDPADYLTFSYYERWVTAAATLAVENGVLTREELEAAAGGAFPLARPRRDGSEPAVVAVGTARFAVGDRVRVRDQHPTGHTRCPGYVRGHAGEVVRVDGTYPNPDIEAIDGSKEPEATYSVRFAADELWHDGQAGAFVNVDLWDSYLDPEDV